MTAAEKQFLATEINKALTHIARGVVDRNELINLVKELYTPKDTYVVITWPECQHYMDLEGWKENSHLINDEEGMDEYGSSAYFVKQEWINSIVS